MASIRLLRGRIRSAKSIAQITKAMQLVAASKMKKAQDQAMMGKLYAEKIALMVMRLAAKVDTSHHPLLAKPKSLTGRKLIIFISTNKGLCGGLNTNLFRFFLHEYTKIDREEFVTIGSKGAALISRLKGKIHADFSGSTPFSIHVPAITQLVISEYLAGGMDGVDIISNAFVSALVQHPEKRTILPLTIDSLGVTDESPQTEYLIEPSPSAVFETLLPHYLENQIRDAIFQAEASEHSARMIAMKNATDNALSLTDELTLLLNKARQEKITYEISDMVTARLAVER